MISRVSGTSRRRYSGFLAFDFKGTCNRSGLRNQKLNVSGGTSTIHTNDAGWFGSTGRFGFNYGNSATLPCSSLAWRGCRATNSTRSVRLPDHEQRVSLHA